MLIGWIIILPQLLAATSVWLGSLQALQVVPVLRGSGEGVQVGNRAGEVTGWWCPHHPHRMGKERGIGLQPPQQVEPGCCRAHRKVWRLPNGLVPTSTGCGQHRTVLIRNGYSGGGISLHSRPPPSPDGKGDSFSSITALPATPLVCHCGQMLLLQVAWSSSLVLEILLRSR